MTAPSSYGIPRLLGLPVLLNEVHRLIENRGIRFLLTESSARKLRRVVDKVTILPYGEFLKELCSGTYR